MGLKYSDEITSNNVAGAHFVFQFIGDTQLATNRPVVETWKLLRKIEMDGSSAPMGMRSFFTGFNRPDGRRLAWVPRWGVEHKELRKAEEDPDRQANPRPK